MAISDTKRALIDVIMLGDLQLKESAGIAEMIESDYITEDYASELLSLAEKLPPGDFRKVLENEYNDNNEKSADIPMLTEEVFFEARNNVLLESNDDDEEGHKYARWLNGQNLFTIAMIYMMADEAKKQNIKKGLKTAINMGLKGYERLQGFLRILPKLPKDAHELKTFWRHIKFDREGVPHLSNAAGVKNINNLWATQDAQGVFHANISKIGVLALGTILAVAGITAMVIAISRYYSATSKEIRKVCGKYPKQTKEYRKCALTLKIKACDQIISKLKQAMKECDKKSNPYKCKNSVQKNIYVWQTRKEDLTTQLARARK